MRRLKDIPPAFKGEELPDSQTTLELIYKSSYDYPEVDDEHLRRGEDVRPRWGSFLEKHQIKAFQGALSIKGRKIAKRGIDGIFLTGINTLILVKERGGVSSYSMEGRHLWDIEPCEFPKGWKETYFGHPGGIKRGRDGRDLLFLYEFKKVFATDLLTGKGTVLWELDEYTEHEKNFL
ncbi:MAG: hypothetical protein WDA09_05415 [Bacteriovoracaceae bacterium]